MSKNSHVNKGIDFTGFRHGKLTVISKCNEGENRWICHCDCGKEIVMIPSIFKKIKSCGCLNIENRKNLASYARTHGMTNTILYSKYCGMKERCYNPNYRHYHRYGGRGIIICDEWLGEHGFENFKKWAYENGYDDNKHGYNQSIDRINVDGDYSPDNCRWCNQLEQARNKENTVYIEYNGNKMPAREFAEQSGITEYVFVFRRIKKGQSADQILHDWNMLYHTPDNYYTVSDCAKEHNVSNETVKKWYRNGLLKAEKIGQKLFIPKCQIIYRNYEDRNEKGQFLSSKPKK